MAGKKAWPKTLHTIAVQLLGCVSRSGAVTFVGVDCKHELPQATPKLNLG
jgi:hypothetical protein